MDLAATSSTPSASYLMSSQHGISLVSKVQHLPQVVIQMAQALSRSHGLESTTKTEAVVKQLDSQSPFGPLPSLKYFDWFPYGQRTLTS